ncbi:minor capsid protein [Ancylobacter rudongensis]|uniref:Uncharacterized protein n=1 Tax=Ancylobacter rudongensis TaxID=177413 RepID=A0A1G4UPV5_9HYPH|nr:minor capsid protein [Ancylobacter rudongensis]SCW95652.1 hypothetical protein SAMN05660859_0078 [Ancylobacter rudongensis]
MIFDILEHKIAAAGLGVPGESLFRGTMPAECTVGVLFRMPLEGIPVDPHIVGWHKPRLQVIVRHTDPVQGEALANKVIKTLLVEHPEDHPATAERGRARITVFYPAQLPIQFPMLEGNAIEWSLNFRTAFSVEPAWK